jgi:hypothetical protein
MIIPQSDRECNRKKPFYGLFRIEEVFLKLPPMSHDLIHQTGYKEQDGSHAHAPYSRGRKPLPPMQKPLAVLHAQNELNPLPVTSFYTYILSF